MLKILFCGDFVSQTPESVSIGKRLKRLIDNQDYIAVNFEAPISGYGEPIKKSGPALSQSPFSPNFLVENGINVILLANNHMMDNGQAACEKTICAFDNSNVHLIGAGEFPHVFNIHILEKDNLKIGLLNLTHKEFGALTIDAQSGDYGTAWINHPLVNQKILKAKNECDYLAVIPHAGIEDIIVPLPEWRARYREFIDLGADIVIGSHPHTPQGCEEYNGKKIYYSLGNFYFEVFTESYGSNWFKSLIIECIIDKNEGIKIKVHNCKFNKNLIEIDDSVDAEFFTQSLNDLLNNTDRYTSYLNEELIKLWPEYKLYILRGIAAVTPYSNMHVLLHSAYGLIKGLDIPLLINNFQCESHCWALERMLNLQLKKI